MKKTATVFLLLSLLLVVTEVLRAQTRPRRVGGTTAGTPPATPSATPARPPVLGGASTSNSPPPTSQASPTPGNDPEEVGEGDIVRVNTTLVTVPVSVMDRNGKYIPNLRKRDFRIYEDGVEQEIAYFASVEKPFTVALVLDTSSSTRFRLEDIQDAAIAFVDQLRHDDRVMVVSFDDRINVLAEPTSDRYTLHRAIRNARTGGGTKLYDAVDLVINQRLNHIRGRKAIVLFTDGVDTTSRHANYQSNMRDAEELDALIYSVQYDTYSDMRGSGYPVPPVIFGRWPFPLPFPVPPTGGGGGRGTRRSDYERADRYLNDLAYKTGARVYRADTTQNLAQAFSLVAEELRRQYSLGYYPKATAQAGERRQIRVRVNQPNLVVRARDSYISGTPASATAQGNQMQPRMRFDR